MNAWSRNTATPANSVSPTTSSTNVNPRSPPAPHAEHLRPEPIRVVAMSEPPSPQFPITLPSGDRRSRVPVQEHGRGIRKGPRALTSTIGGLFGSPADQDGP